MQIAQRGPMMVGVLWTFQFIAFALIGLRVYSRLVVVRTYGWDDHFFGISVSLLLVYNVLLTTAANYGLGQKTSVDSTPNDQSQALLHINIAQSVLNIASITIKLSIAIFLYRLVSPSRPKRLAIMIPAVLLTIILLAAMFVVWFSCTPIKYGWDWYVAGGSCNDLLQFVAVVIAGLAVVLIEVFYATFAWYLIRGLQIPRTEKIVIGVCMSIGYISAICSIWRLIALVGMTDYAGSDDSYLYIFPDVLLWQAADITTQLICITVTVCRPLYKDWLNTLVDNAKTSVRSHLSSNRSARETNKVNTSSNFSMIALQTIGGSSVPLKTRAKATGRQADAAGVKVDRSWKVESNTRSMLFPDDADSEENILCGTGIAEIDLELERQS